MLSKRDALSLFPLLAKSLPVERPVLNTMENETKALGKRDNIVAHHLLIQKCYNAYHIIVNGLRA